MNIVASIFTGIIVWSVPLYGGYKWMQYRNPDRGPTKGIEKKIFDFYQKIAPPGSLNRKRILFAIITFPIGVLLIGIFVHSIAMCILSPLLIHKQLLAGSAMGLLTYFTVGLCTTQIKY